MLLSTCVPWNYKRRDLDFFFFSSLKQKHQSVWGRTVQTSAKQRWVCSGLRIWTRRGDKLSLLPSFETTDQYFIVFFFLYVCDRTQTQFQTHPSHPTGCNLNVAAEKKASGAVEPLGLEPDCRDNTQPRPTFYDTQVSCLDFCEMSRKTPRSGVGLRLVLFVVQRRHNQTQSCTHTHAGNFHFLIPCVNV